MRPNNSLSAHRQQTRLPYLRLLFGIAALSSFSSCFPYPIVVDFQPSYAVDFLKLSPPSGQFGFDLDGMNSLATDPAGCLKADAASPSELGAQGFQSGVDNMLSSLAMELNASIPTLLTDWNDSVQNSRTTFVLSLSDVQSFENDTSVRARMIVALPTFGSPCQRNPNAEFAIWDRVVEGKDTVVNGSGTIVNGVLNLTFEASPAVSFPIRYMNRTRVLNLPLREFRVRATIPSADLPLTNLNIGARMSAPDLIAALQAAEGLGMVEPDASAMVSRLIDLPGMNGCSRTNDPTTSASVSIGFGGSAPRVRLSSTSLRSPPPGTCGSN